jgi:hypothetical protein
MWLSGTQASISVLIGYSKAQAHTKLHHRTFHHRFTSSHPVCVGTTITLSHFSAEEICTARSRVSSHTHTRTHTHIHRRIKTPITEVGSRRSNVDTDASITSGSEAYTYIHTYIHTQTQNHIEVSSLPQYPILSDTHKVPCVVGDWTLDIGKRKN